MLRIIDRECLETSAFTGISKFQQRVMYAMAEVPREKFVPTNLVPFAYQNGPLPIGNGQTISQPYIVALMTDLLLPEDDDVILEVGAGSGYQAAILSKLVKQVYSIEIISSLMRQARDRLAKLGFQNIEVLESDGYAGLPAHAPYDGIIVTAAASHVPPPLIEQLKPGGRLVIPLGLPASLQYLMLLEKNSKGKVTSREILAVSFVPLTRGAQDGE
jgi:protein-L-isoaspartate(D-aspartate) O-methyltransferase